MFSCTAGDPTETASGGCLCHRPEIHALTRRIGAGPSRRSFVAGAAATIGALGLAKGARAQGMQPPRAVLFINARLFDGSPILRDGVHLLVEGSTIKALAAGTPATPEGAQVIDCGGRVLMPGLIDAHWHAIFAALPIPVLMAADVGYIHLAAAAEAERTLMRGFTTVRDLGGPAFALKQSIDEGLLPGPRIFPSGAMITAAGGHGDLRPVSDLPAGAGQPRASEQTGGAITANSPAEVRMRVREQLMQGASQLKIVAGGGVSSPRSPLDATTFSEAEMRAAVEAAADWGTYATAHAYAPETVQRALAAGVACIEHGHLMDETTARMIADKGVWLSIQPFLGAEDSVPLTGPGFFKLQQVIAGTDKAYNLAKTHGIKTAFGSDMLFSPALTRRQGTMLTHLTRWYTPAQLLKMATATNGELMALSTRRNPYPGKLGVLEAGALADLLLVDGNPLDDASLIANPDKNFLVIMKDGKIYKNTLT
ncbi:metal-dependent hydrolase family protein [Chelatococcus reniformis]|uniref:Amidohydrolase n=1 Tax=Chelatococcus reniformis TaxID=1494448 RepID=A0A916UKW6_9HYPH|nr:amidohydrolase family protein [Chelatococcus reniformis]GGC76855.1 amidohydrolase [Chelatococcus reniformis]